MEKKYNLVYKTVNLVNDKIYIGVHCTDDLDDGYLGSGKLLKRAIKKYGRKIFKRYTLHDFITAEHAYGVEEIIVDKYFILRDDNYNTAVGGGLPFKDRRHTKESKQKIGAAHKGIPKSAESNRKSSLSQKGFSRPETTGSKNGMARRVQCITTGEIFDTVRAAVIKHNVASSSIAKCCQGKRNSAGRLSDGTKLKWKYLENNLK